MRADLVRTWLLAFKASNSSQQKPFTGIAPGVQDSGPGLLHTHTSDILTCAAARYLQILTPSGAWRLSQNRYTKCELWLACTISTKTVFVVGGQAGMQSNLRL